MMEQEREVIMQREKRKRGKKAFLKHGPRRDEKERGRVICHVVHQNECFLHDFFDPR